MTTIIIRINSSFISIQSLIEVHYNTIVLYTILYIYYTYCIETNLSQFGYYFVDNELTLQNNMFHIDV